VTERAGWQVRNPGPALLIVGSEELLPYLQPVRYCLVNTGCWPSSCSAFRQTQDERYLLFACRFNACG